MTQGYSVAALLQNPRVAGFVRSLIEESYQEYFKGHREEVLRMIGRAWDALTVSSSTEGTFFVRAVDQISTEIFRKRDPSFWFNVDYQAYKTNTKPRKDFMTIWEFIRGRVLDFGSGGGHFALVLTQRGFEVSTTDVLDYRIAEAKSLPFRPMTSPTDIPYPDNSFDTTIVKAVLHHIDGTDLPTVLKELHRVSTRLVVEEDTYDVPRNTPRLDELLESQPALKTFVALRPEDQRQALMLIDFFANAVAQGVGAMNFPFAFKTIPEWRDAFGNCGLVLTNTVLLGFQPRNVNKSCHVMLIADRAST